MSEIFIKRGQKVRVWPHKFVWRFLTADPDDESRLLLEHENTGALDWVDYKKVRTLDDRTIMGLGYLEPTSAYVLMGVQTEGVGVLRRELELAGIEPEDGRYYSAADVERLFRELEPDA